MVQDTGSGASVVMTTSGDMVKYQSGARARLGIGSANQILQVKSSLPSWETLSTADSVLTTQGDVLYEGASALARLGQSTNFHTLATKGAGANPAWQPSATSTLTTTGDLLYASGANTLSRLASVSSGQVLTAQGVGSAPAWATPAGGGAWTELYNSGVIASTGALETGVMAEKKHIHFMIHTANVSSNNLAIRFNDTSNGEYAWNGFYNTTGNTSTSADRDAIQFLIAGSSGTFFVGCNGYIHNTEGNEKLVSMISVENNQLGDGNYPLDSYWVGKWSNTSDFIDEIQITDDGGTANDQQVGSQLVVWGAD